MPCERRSRPRPSARRGVTGERGPGLAPGQRRADSVGAAGEAGVDIGAAGGGGGRGSIGCQLAVEPVRGRFPSGAAGWAKVGVGRRGRRAGRGPGSGAAAGGRRRCRPAPPGRRSVSSTGASASWPQNASWTSASVAGAARRGVDQRGQAALEVLAGGQGVGEGRRARPGPRRPAPPSDRRARRTERPGLVRPARAASPSGRDGWSGRRGHRARRSPPGPRGPMAGSSHEGGDAAGGRRGEADADLEAAGQTADHDEAEGAGEGQADRRRRLEQGVGLGQLLGAHADAAVGHGERVAAVRRAGPDHLDGAVGRRELGGVLHELGEEVGEVDGGVAADGRLVERAAGGSG